MSPLFEIFQPSRLHSPFLAAGDFLVRSPTLVEGEWVKGRTYEVSFKNAKL